MKIYWFLFIFQSFVYGFQVSEGWIPIFKDEQSTIYLNSSKIIGYGNDISVWAIEEFHETQTLENGTSYIKSKTHYLFNKMKRKYALVGNIYYDKKGKIVNRASNSGFENSSSAFMSTINSDPKIEKIYKESISYLITDTIIPFADSTSSGTKVSADENIETEVATFNTDDISPSAKNDTSDVINLDESNEESLVTEQSDEENIGEGNSNDLENVTSSDNVQIIDKPNIESVVKLKEVDSKSIENKIIIAPPKPIEYNQSNERALKNAIFTDGNLYCIQVSSWKTRAYADRELNKLLNRGFKAFIVSVKPKNKRSIWHRVRVGYFETLEEAKRVQREIKRK